MSNRESFKKILDVAVHAPSGDNSQPWRFKIDENSISIFNLEDRDPTLYNFRQRGSYFAHGAVIENIAIAARNSGYAAEVEVFPGQKACTARITLKQAAPEPDPLYVCIAERATNRKPYRKQKLNPDHKNSFSDSVKKYAEVSLKFIEDRKTLEELANSISLNERLVMENRALHDFLFGIIRWSKDEEEKNPGLYIETMEFPPPQRMMLKLLKHWGFVRVANLIGFSRIAPKGSAQLYKSSSAIGAIILKKDGNEDFISAGRAFPRAWLTATKLGISIQPITAMPYLAQRVAAGEGEVFSPGQKAIIDKAYGNISEIFGLGPRENIAMLFRIGYGDAPSARSSKLSPVIE